MRSRNSPSALAAGAVLAALLAPGCGNGRSDEEQAVARAVTGWHDAVVKHDSPRACAYLTPKLRRAIDSQVRTHSEPGNCRTWAARWTFGPTRPVGKRDARIGHIRVSGDRATAKVQAAPYEDSDVMLRRLGGRWLIDNYN